MLLNNDGSVGVIVGVIIGVIVGLIGGERAVFKCKSQSNMSKSLLSRVEYVSMSASSFPLLEVTPY